MLLHCDAVDALFLDWFSSFVHSGKMERKEIEGQWFYWLKYSYVLDDLPILGIEQQALRKRIKRLVDNKVVDLRVVKNRFGTKTYFRFWPDSYNLLTQTSKEPTDTKVSVGTGTKVSVRTDTKVSPKDPLTNPLTNPPTRTKQKKKPKRNGDYTSEPYGEQFLEVFALYPPRRPSNPKRTAYKAFVKLMRDGVNFDALKRAVVNYAEERKGKEPEFTMMARTFFGPNERWQDFLSPTGESPKSSYHANVVEDDLGIGELVKKAQRRPA